MLSDGDSVPRIDYHANGISSDVYKNQRLEKEAFIEQQDKNKTLSNLLEIENTAPQKTPYISKDKSGIYVKKLNFTAITDIREINAASYLYGGLTNFFQQENLGIALDHHGNLLLIKGKSRNLIKGLYKKYTSGYLYQSACLTGEIGDIKFNHLYLNPYGLLVGEEKINNIFYHISIEHISSSVEAQTQMVQLCLSQYEKKITDEKLHLQKKDLTDLYFHYQNNKLVLDHIQIAGRPIDYSIMGYDINIPINKNYSINSIKTVRNSLQIETQKGAKRRIIYLSPEHISLKKLTAKKISHKPPQNFASRLGRDPHEKYHAGHPFTSDRKGNFSSQNIPLFSSVMDKFRLQVQAATDNRAQGKRRKAFAYLAKSLDPGFQALYTMAADRIKHTRQKPEQGCTQDKLSMLNGLLSQTTALIPPLDRMLGNTLPSNLSDALISMVKQLKIRESITLENSNRVSGFFGIAVGGMPFNPGWFAGIVMILAKSYNLALYRVDNNHINITFGYRRKNSAIAILGTGQGLEKTLINTPVINYMTVMPAEANLILAVHCTKGCDFSFTLALLNKSNFC